MPASPHFERFTLIDEGESITVVAIAHQDFDGTEVVMLVDELAFDEPKPDMDAWLRVVAVDDRGERQLQDVPDALVDPAWAAFESSLSLNYEENTE